MARIIETFPAGRVSLPDLAGTGTAAPITEADVIGSLPKEGASTAPDVAKLSKALGVLTAGDVLTYSSMALILGLPVKSYRFRTVLCAWRAKLYDMDNLVLLPVRGMGLRVASGSERVVVSRAKIKVGFNAMSKGADIAMRTPRVGLSSEDLTYLKHVSTVSAAARLAEATSARELGFDPLT